MIDEAFIPQIIKNLPEIIERGLNDDSKKILSNIDLCEDHIGEVFYLIEKANLRVSFINSGMNAKRITSDLDNDKIFIAATRVLKPKPTIKNTIGKLFGRGQQLITYQF